MTNLLVNETLPTFLYFSKMAGRPCRISVGKLPSDREANVIYMVVNPSDVALQMADMVIQHYDDDRSFHTPSLSYTVLNPHENMLKLIQPMNHKRYFMTFDNRVLSFYPSPTIIDPLIEFAEKTAETVVQVPANFQMTRFFNLFGRKNLSIVQPPGDLGFSFKYDERHELVVSSLS